MAPPSFDAHDSHVLCLRFSPDSKILVSGDGAGLIKLWSVEAWQPMGTLARHTGGVTSLAFSPDNLLLASGSEDATVRLWSLPDGRLIRTLRDRRKPVRDVAFSADGRLLAAASDGGRTAVWTVEGQPATTIVVGRQNLTSVVFSPDGRLLMIAGQGGEISAWSMPEPQRVVTLDSRSVVAGWLHFVDDGRALVSMGYEQDVVFWDTTTWQRIHTYPMDRKNMRSLVISPDEALMGLGMVGKVELRSTVDMELQAELRIGTPSISLIAFSPDGRWLAISGAEGKITPWRLRRWG